MSATTAPVRGTYDVARVRADFPILREVVHDKPLVYTVHDPTLNS